MNPSPRAPLSPRARRWRALALYLGAAGVIGGLGCATMLVSEKRNPHADAHRNQPTLTDTIYAVAQPDAKLAKKLGTESAFAFLGHTHTYLLVEGGDVLARLAAAKLDGRRVTIEQKPRTLFLKDRTIWGDLTVRYQLDPAAGPTPDERAALAELGFQSAKPGDYLLGVRVNGLCCPPAKVDAQVLTQLTHTRPITFYNAPNSQVPPDLSKIVLVPLAVVVDLALTPVYLGGFLLFVLASN
jgi:hypothetical protein